MFVVPRRAMPNRVVTKNSPMEIVESVKFVNRFYPTNKVVKDGDWQIVKVASIENGDTFTVVGNMVAMTDEYDTTYKIGCTLKYNDKREEWQYVPYYSQEVYEFKTLEDQKTFLGSILSESQLNRLFETFENPIQMFEEERFDELLKVKGIGAKTLDKIKARYDSCKDKGKAYVELGKYGLSVAIIERLVKRYNSPDVAVSKVKENPYVLATEVKGIGFKKADEIALSVGMSKDSVERGMAFILHHFEEKANDGDSYMEYEELLKGIDEYLGVEYPDDSIDEAMRRLNETGKLWFKDCVDDDGYEYTLVANRKYYEIEKEIAYHIKRLMDAPTNIPLDRETAMEMIKNQQVKQGWNYTERQIEGIFACMENNVVVITGLGGCVDADTEFFNGIEWKRIADYKDDELVLQYNEDGSAKLVKPSKYVKYPEEFMYHFKTKYGVDQCLSWEHRVVYETSRGNLKVKPFHEVMTDHNNSGSGFSGKFYTTFDYNGVGIDMSDEEIRLQIAVIADGSFNKDRSTNWCTMRLKKDRKCKRIETLLMEANIEYKKTYEASTGFYIYRFYAPRREKEFESYWYECSKHQFTVVCDEIMHWDGSQIHKNSFYSTSKKTVDFIQFAFATVGKRCSIMIDDRVGKPMTGKEEYSHKRVGYYFTPTTRNKVGIGGFGKGEAKTPIVKVPTKDGYKYCFEVESSMLVLRRNGRIFITGNTGKSSCVSGVLKCVEGDYSFCQTALSGRAAVNLADITGEEGLTIHSLLGYNPKTHNYAHNEENPLCTDMLILDEASMVDIELALHLLRAVPTGAKFVMLGDTNQLEAIGAGNLLMDLIDSEAVATIVFDKVHRQGAKSAIKTESKKIADGEQLVGKTWVGEQVLGELQDLKYIGFTHKYGSSDARPTIDLIVNEFKEMFKEAKEISDIAIVVPTRANGSGCYPINLRIQDIYLPKRSRGTFVELGTEKQPFNVYVGDKVINLKNNRNTYYYEKGMDEYGNEVEHKISRPIYNGNVGEVVEIIDTSTMVVDFYNIGKVIVNDKQLDEIALGYAITVHKCQGSTVPYVIGAIDYTHYSMLTRQLAYTLMSRAKTKMTFIFESRALHHAISTNDVTHKRTFLYHILTGRLE